MGVGNPLSCSASMSSSGSSCIKLLLRKPSPHHHRHQQFQFGFLSTFASPLVLRMHASSLRLCSEKLSRHKSAREIIGRKVGCSLLKVEDKEEEEEEEEESCELVSGVQLSVGEGVDSINAYLFKAMKNNNGTGILLLSDILGFQDSSTREFAYRVACNGYNVLLPDLFRGDPWTKDRPDILFDDWIAKQEPQRVVKDIATSAKWMVDEFAAAGISNKLGLVGFCFGGGKVVEVLARDQGAYFGVGVSFYGTRIGTSAASNVNVPILFISGDNDPLCPVNVLDSIEKSIGRGSRLVVFKGRGHGFAHRPQSFQDDEDADQAFMMMRNWLHDGLDVANHC